MTKKTTMPGWPDMSIPGMPGLGNPLGDSPLARSFTGGFDFMKKLWGGLPESMPGLVIPTIDIEELDKRIEDLKAVETWLEINANMLRGTIQALEVQRNTVATLKSLGGTFGGGANEILKSMNSLSQAAQVTKPGPPPVEARAPLPPPAPIARRRPAAKKTAATATKGAAPAAQSGGAASAWLDFLQNQFNQVALAALTPTSKAAPEKSPLGARAAPARRKTTPRKRS